jgi:integration host factor subunit alpha
MKRALTKREIAEIVSKELGYSSRISLKLVNDIFAQIKSSLINGDKVKITRFGTLQSVRKPIRRGTNPVNGEPIIIPAQRTVVFRPSRLLKRIVNDSKGEEILPDRRGKRADRC